MRALPLIIILLVASALAYTYRSTITTWFTGQQPEAQTVVLRQTVAPQPVSLSTATPAFTATPAPTSIANIATSAPINSSTEALPKTGPADDLLVVGLISIVTIGLWSWAAKPGSPKQPLDIL